MTNTKYLRVSVLGCLSVLLLFQGCTATSDLVPSWHLQLAHDANGNVTDGSEQNLVATIRAGCQIRVAWGARRRADPQRTIEHSAEPQWISVRDGQSVAAQIGGFTPNLSVFGEDPASHPRFERFGGTETLVEWRADIATDGSFNAVWYQPHSGTFVERVPQQHPMRWYADCVAISEAPLYPSEL
ncbi:MAG: hypothetical protein AAFN07_13805 [Pseudomonadota bacterium]